MKKKYIIVSIVAFVLVVAIIFGVIFFVNNSKKNPSKINPANPQSSPNEASTTIGKLVVSKETASVGDSVDVVVSIKDNPGVLGMTLSVNYSTSVMTLVDAKSGEAFDSVLTFTKPGEYGNRCKFLWDAMDIEEGQIKDGDILVLTFKINDKAEPGEYPVAVSYRQDDIVDRNLQFVDMDIEDGSVIIR